MEEKVYSEEEMKDGANIKEYYEKIKDYGEFAKKLSSYFSKKYGSDFGGEIKFEYDMTENKIRMICNKRIREFEIYELMEIPAHIQFLRRTAAHK